MRTFRKYLLTVFVGYIALYWIIRYISEVL